MSQTRTIRIENAYADGDEVTNEMTVSVARREEFDSDEAYDDYLMDELYQYTGTGRTDRAARHSFHSVDSIDGLVPEIHLEWG